MTNTKKFDNPDLFQVGNSVFYKEHDWEIAEIQVSCITLYRDSIDGQSKTEKISIKDLQEALLH